MYTLSVRHPTSTSITDNKMVNIPNADLKYLLRYFQKPHLLTRYTLDTYYALTRAEQTACKLHLPYFCGAHFIEKEDGSCERKKTNITARNLLTYDIDYGNETTWDSLLQKLRNLKINFFLHTSISHNPSKNLYKYRLIVPLAPSYLVESSREYQLIFEAFCGLLHEPHTKLNGTIFDLKVSHDIARAIYSPTVLTGQSYKLEYEIAAPNFCVDKTTLLQSWQAPATLTHTLKPSEMSGLQGLFNGTYTALDVLHTYGSDRYAPCHPQDPLNPALRWFFRGASTQSGIRFYENGEWLHSEHDSDPLNQTTANGTVKQWDAYSLFVYLAHDGDETAAQKAITSDPQIIGKLETDFKDLQSEIVEISKTKIIDYLTQDEIQTMIECTSPKIMLDFIIRKMHLIARNGEMRFLLPIRIQKTKTVKDAATGELVKTYTYSTELFILKRGDTGFQAMFGYCGELPDPYNPKKMLPPSEYVVRYCTAMRRYVSLDFMPYNPYSKRGQEILESQATSLRLNTFRGFSVAPYFDYRGTQAAAEAVQLFHDYVHEIVCAGDPRASCWLLDWIADIFQNPEERNPTAVFLYSPEQGLGKGTLFNILGFILGRHAQLLDTKIITGEFNHSLSECLLGLFDDIEWQLKKDAGKMRRFISEPLMTITPKYVDAYQITSCARFMITANHLNVLEVDGSEGERRVTMLRVAVKFPMLDPDRAYTLKEKEETEEKNATMRTQKLSYFTKLYTSCQIHSNALLAALLERKITSNLKEKCHTSLYENVKDAGHSGVDALLMDMSVLNVEQLQELFNGSDDFGDSENVIDKNNALWVKKQSVFHNYRENYAPKTTTHMFNGQLRASKLIEKYDIDFTGRVRGKFCRLYLNGKSVDMIRIPKEFFNRAQGVKQ